MKVMQNTDRDHCRSELLRARRKPAPLTEGERFEPAGIGERLRLLRPGASPS